MGGGRTLRGLLDAQGPQSPGAAREVLWPMAAALDYAHRQGAAHGLLHPGFVWLADHRQAKIAGFGIANAYAAMAWDPGPQGCFLAYVAPERFAPGKVLGGPNADQFALAAIAYEMLAGRRPFIGTNLGKIVWAVTQQQPAPVHEVNRSVPESLWKPLRRALGLYLDAESGFGELCAGHLEGEPESHY